MTLPGYLFRPGASGTPRPTLLMIGSSDTVVEDLYAEIGPAGLRRSSTRIWWTCLARDLPFAGW